LVGPGFLSQILTSRRRKLGVIEMNPGEVYQIKSKEEFDKCVSDAGSTLLVVDFFAVWCGPCKMISPKVQDLAKSNMDVLFIKVDVDEVSEVAEACKISAMPTFAFYKNGKEEHRFEGASELKLAENIKKYK